MAYLAIISIREGRKAGFVTVVGIAVGLLTVSILVALGLGEIISNSPSAHQILRIVGFLYLLWLAWDGWKNSDQMTSAQAHEPLDKQKHFNRGLITNLLNPKAALFYVAVLPAFTNDTTPITAQLITLSIIYVSIATCIHILIVSLSSQLKPLLSSPKRSLIVSRALSLLLVIVAIWFFITTRLG